MGTRFNVLMTIQIPLQQKQKRPQRASAFMQWGASDSGDEDGCSDSCSDASDGSSAFMQCGASDSDDEDGCSDSWSDASDGCATSGGEMGGDLLDLMSEPVEAAPTMGAAPAMMMRGSKKKAAAAPVRKGKANAARVSRGTEVDMWHGLSVKVPVGSDFRLADSVYPVAVTVYLSVNSGSLGPACVFAGAEP